MIPFFVFLSDKKKKFEGDKKYQVFEDINELQKEKLDTFTQKLKLNLDTKYIIHTGEYAKRFALEIKYKKQLEEQKLLRCLSCGFILPHPFIIPEKKSVYLVKPFVEKVENEFDTYTSKFIFHKDFSHNEIKTTEDLYTSFQTLAKAYVSYNVYILGKKTTYKFRRIWESYGINWNGQRYSL